MKFRSLVLSLITTFTFVSSNLCNANSLENNFTPSNIKTASLCTLGLMFTYFAFDEGRDFTNQIRPKLIEEEEKFWDSRKDKSWGKFFKDLFKLRCYQIRRLLPASLNYMVATSLGALLIIMSQDVVNGYENIKPKLFGWSTPQ